MFFSREIQYFLLYSLVLLLCFAELIESQLSMLRADQRLKVEELKKKTAYYSTKTLLERYDVTKSISCSLNWLSLGMGQILKFLSLFARTY